MNVDSIRREIVQRLLAGGSRLEYGWYGPPPDERPTLVFLHEGLGCVGMWEDFPARLSEATGCGALVYSRAGYGGSDPADLPRPAGFMHNEALITLPQVLDEARVCDAILVGHSDGGSIALIYAGSSKADRVRALVLEAPHVFVEEISIRSIAASAERYTRGHLRLALERYHGRNVDCAFWGWNNVWLDPQFRSWNIEMYLPHIRVPVLVIQGNEDEYGTIRQVDAIARGCAGLVSSLILPNCGHNPHRAEPHRTLEAMASFISEQVLGVES